MQILYAGDEFMKRKYSICIFAAVLLAVSGILVWFGTAGRGGSDKEQTKTQEEWQENTEENAIYSGKTQESYEYIIFDVDGHLLVYYSDNTTVFFDTGILSHSLSEEMQKQLTYGIRFADEDELYEFLENYSS